MLSLYVCPDVILTGSWSLDQISLDLFSRSKVFKLIFGTRSNYFSFFTRSKDFGTRSKDFGTRSKVLKALFCIIKTFDLVPKSVRTNLALDRKF